MKTIQVPTTDQISETANTILEQVRKKIGKIPNLYATIGYSPEALQSMLTTEATLAQHASFSAKEREAINLIVSQVNDCDYCLAAHTALAISRGFSVEDTLAIRKASYADVHLNTVIRLAKSITSNKGAADDELLDSFFKEGFDEKALIELIALISLRSFTNYVFTNTRIPVDFPAAPAL